MTVDNEKTQAQSPSENKLSNNKEMDTHIMAKKYENQQINSIQTILAGADAVTGDENLTQGLENLASMASLDVAKPIRGMSDVEAGVMGFRRKKNNLTVAFVCGISPTFNCPTEKFIRMVESSHDPETRTVLIQNCSETVDGDGSRPQVLARLNPKHSALHVIWGHHGKVIYGSDQIAKHAVYYVHREDLLCYYLAAKAQIRGGDRLEALLAANDGWLEYDIPSNPLDPAAV